MKKTIAIVSTMCVVLLAIFVSLRAVSAETTPPTAAVSIAEAAPTQLSFSLESGALSLVDGQLVADALNTRLQEPGAPALPYYSTLIAVPPGADVSVTVREEQVDEQRGVELAPAPTLVLDYAEPKADVTADDTSEQLIEDAAIYGSAAPYPAQLYDLSDPMYYRDVRVVRLSLYPVRYAAATQTVIHAQRLAVDVQFVGGAVSAETTPLAGDLPADFSSQILNADQAAEWRDMPAAPEGVPLTIPIGVESFKIEVDQAGIYELTYADLAAAGMDVTNVDPNTFEMMHLGQTVAFDFIGNGNTDFEPGEAVRFYGFPFESTREEMHHVKYNVFWLWADGSPTAVAHQPNGSGFTPVTSVTDTVVFDQDTTFFAGWTDDWSDSENEPTAFYWQFQPQSGASATFNYSVNVPHPTAPAPNGSFSVEIFGAYADVTQHNFTVTINSDPNSQGQKSWTGEFANANVVGPVVASTLISGTNNVSILSTGTPRDFSFLDSIAITYWRNLVADNDQIRFAYGPAGSHAFPIAGFSVSDPAQIAAWDISDPLLPVAITLTAGDISNSINSSTVTLNRVSGGDVAFVVQATPQLLSPVTVSEFVAEDLEPAGGGAAWVAVAYGDFLAPVNQLAAHRAAYSNLTTHVVDVDQVMNQYSYGLRLPHGIQAYIAHAFATWTEAPRYVLLGGDATNNPKQLPCGGGGIICLPSQWSTTEYAWVPTFFRPVDRFLGHISSDHFFVSVVGNDELADAAIGRLAANTEAEMQIMVDKIILYENNLLSPQPWMSNMLYVSDTFDPTAGNFCAENNEVATNHVPSSYNSVEMCWVQSTDPGATNLRNQMFDYVDDIGALVMNYRGHGAINDWSDGIIMQTPRDLGLWFNDNPMILLSADCLDGSFASPGLSGLAESIMRLPNNAGTAAHWSSTGLGFSLEHTKMHVGFYDAIFEDGLTAIGDAIVSSKAGYLAAGQDISEMYAFTLQGDPAMQFMRPDLALALSAEPVAPLTLGESVTITVDVSNSGLYATPYEMTFTVPPSLAVTSVDLPAGATFTQNGNVIVVSSNVPLPIDQSAAITLVAELISVPAEDPVVLAEVSGLGYEIDAGNQSAELTIPAESDPTAVTLGVVSAESNSALILSIAMFSLLLTTLALPWLRYQRHAVRK